MKFARVFSFAAALAILLIAPALRADVTVRYKTEVKMGSGAPPAVTQQTAGVMKTAVPASTVIRIKGTKGYTSSGNMVTLMDFAKQVITVVDPAHNQYATVYMKDYVDQVLSAMPMPGVSGAQSEAAQKALASMKSDFSSEKTGKMDTILGIQAEETKLTLIVYMPSMGAGDASTDASATPPELMKMIVHLWTAVPSEVENLPSLHEFATVYGNPDADSVLNPSAILGKAFGGLLGGSGKGFAEVMDELSKKKAVTLRTNMEMYMPFMASLTKSAAASGKEGSFDPTAAVFEMKMEMEDISAAPIEDSVFEVPRDAQSVSVPDFLRALLPAAAASQSASLGAAPATPASSAAPQSDATAQADAAH